MCRAQPSIVSKTEESSSLGSGPSTDVDPDGGGVKNNSASATPIQADACLSNDDGNSAQASSPHQIRRRRKRDRLDAWSKDLSNISNHVEESQQRSKRIITKKKKSKMASKHGDDSKSGGMDALIPSAIGIVVLIFVVMARMGFRGRATVAGIDLGTTNSVVCIQAPSSGLGEIECIPDPRTGSPVVPSVVSFLDNHHLRSFRLTKDEKERTWPNLVPHPVDVVVGKAAKDRIDGHPHHTVYHAKRIIGRKHHHESVASLRGEVDFDILPHKDGSGTAAFGVPYHLPSEEADIAATKATTAILSPSEIGAYIIHHLRSIARDHLRHDNVRSAVIAIPAKFEPAQRDATIRAFELAGLKVARILEEPTAAALAYGLHKRDDVHYVMVYDFGGGTLDVSLLYIGEGGYIEVLGSDGDERLGGADFDAAVAHWLLERKGGADIVGVVAASVERIEEGMANGGGSKDRADADLIEEVCPKLVEAPLCTISSFHTIGERMKIWLSGHPEESAVETCHRLPPTMDVKSVPGTADELCDAIVPVELSLTLEEYDLAVHHLYDRSLLPVRWLLRDLNLRKEEVDEVVMVGGTTRMPQIRELVRKELEKERLNTHIDPDLTVAYGAASVID